ncbi:MAG TPA: DUF2339 domain-containing protein [Dyella sp.]|uniref:DUF2339 domain-containing protein n=1 Tax=Dyella sp. TaxID=1869338 RepID=UPI002F936ABB
MALLWIVVGLVVGGLAGQSVFGALAGAAIGAIWARQSHLARELAATRAQLAQLTARERAAVAEDIVRRAAQPAPPPVAPAVTEPPAPPPVVPKPVTVAPPVPTEPSWFERLWQRAWSWFTEGNVPVKVGILVLFAGIAALLKYAADSGLLRLPMSLRLSAVALIAIAGLAFGWRQRDRRRVFALSVQGGAIGVLIIVTFAAFRLYQLIPAGAAFAILLVLTAGIGLLAVLQDALALAMLGLIAGFAAPILVSTGAGSHVVLFSYYALLNLAILGIAWKRAWRVLNLLGFIATFGIGTAWGVLKYQPGLFASTEPFLVLNFLFYLIIPWLHVLRAPADRRLVIDGSLMFGNPLASLLLQGALLSWDARAMAFSALIAAAIYIAFAFALRKHPAMHLLRETWAVLAVAFATLAVPLGLSANVTGAIFALEGAGLVWFGMRQQRAWMGYAGIGLQLAAATALLLSHVFTMTPSEALPLLDRDFIGAMLLVLAGVVSAWLFVRSDGGRTSHRMFALAFYLWAMLWWLIGWGGEIGRIEQVGAVFAAWVALFAVTALLVAHAALRCRVHELGFALRYSVPAALGAVTLVLIASAYLDRPLAGWNLAAVALAAALGWLTLVAQRDMGLSAVLSQLAWLWRWIVIAMLAVKWALDGVRWLSPSWIMAALLVPALVVLTILLWRPRTIASPLHALLPAWRTPMIYSLLAPLVVLAVGLLFVGGSAAPVRYMPLLNPLELTWLAIAVCVARWLADPAVPVWLRGHRAVIGAAALLLFATSAALRAVHQLADVPWDDRLAHSSIAQMTLTLVWSVLGLLAWVLGSRRGKRLLWLAGAILMGVVLAKLLLVDRAQLGNLFGIGSFIAYGVLCTIIGYLAPAPPRQPSPSIAKEEGTHAP